MSGRKSMHEKWITPEGLLRLEGWARDGMTDEEIAAHMKIGVRTFYTWKKMFPQIAEATRKGKDDIDYEVEKALLKNAMSGNVAAQIFWLKNRKPALWRDKPDPTVNEELPDDGLKEQMEAAAARLGEIGDDSDMLPVEEEDDSAMLPIEDYDEDFI